MLLENLSQAINRYVANSSAKRAFFRPMTQDDNVLIWAQKVFFANQVQFGISAQLDESYIVIVAEQKPAILENGLCQRVQQCAF